MTIGFGRRTILGTWMGARQRRWVLNVLGFGRHWQVTIKIDINTWKR